MKMGKKNKNVKRKHPIGDYSYGIEGREREEERERERERENAFTNR